MIIRLCTSALHGCRLPTHDFNQHCVAQAYGRELQEAYEWCQRYKASRRDAELHQAWDLYYHVFKRINKQLPSLTVLELQYVAPALVRAQVWLLLYVHYLLRSEDMMTFALLRAGRSSVVNCNYFSSQGRGSRSTRGVMSHTGT